jgi:hypothetical protein
MIGGKKVEQWGTKSIRPMSKFKPQQEKETYQRSKKEILGPDWLASTSSMFLVCDHTMPEKPLEKVINLRDFMRIGIELMKCETKMNSLCDMIDHCAQEREFISHKG